MSLQRKVASVAVVAGDNGGVGSAIVSAFAEHGASVVIDYIARVAAVVQAKIGTTCALLENDGITQLGDGL